MKPDESIFLQHVRDAFNKIESYLEGVDEATFKSDTLLQIEIQKILAEL